VELPPHLRKSGGRVNQAGTQEEDVREEVNEALKAAMKSRDAARVSALRMVSAAFKDRDILARGQGAAAASDDELVAVLAKIVRQREESASAFEAGDRPELAGKERAEIEVIRAFMPKQMAEEEIGAAVEAAIAETGATSIRDMGKVMAVLKQSHAGKLDFSRASALVKARLG
jgi:uncharacterized protein YqeY